MINIGSLRFGNRTMLKNGFMSQSAEGIKAAVTHEDPVNKVAVKPFVCRHASTMCSAFQVQRGFGSRGELLQRPVRAVLGTSLRGMQRSPDQARGDLLCPSLPRHPRVTAADFATRSPSRALHASGTVGRGPIRRQVIGSERRGLCR